MRHPIQIPPVSQALKAVLQDKIDQKTKPPGSLGKLEQVALQAGMIQNTLTPELKKPAIIVFAGDHGIAAEGLVNPFPQAVTAQMVYNFLQGGAAINVFCRQHQLQLLVVDAGVNHAFAPHPLLKDRKIAMGTQHILHRPAMSQEQCALALQAGAEEVTLLHAGGCNTVGFGEMGIGNTSAAALLMSHFTGIPVAECTGAGSNVQQLTQKRAVLQQVMAHHATPLSPEQALATFGGFEIAMITGAILQAAALGMLVVIDGFIVTSALLVAAAIQPAVKDYCIFAHCSEEKGHRKMLEHLGVHPLLQLDMRLGEGTGAALAIPVIQSAVAFLTEMASFNSAQISNRTI
ncbi:nicotinate-nucleotide--dimethylbenzimidazole phosphoribosyltransferase [Chitinophaga nivalis]|uniref:Nicotinate-nucleotide--dimethylbenzimidazole phosphoribosyltransferase n=1 Tax=Chitinophaga nivalis TaxID=2991709 RepID=A0ABT3IWE4_9BACT|nr:nicotinate-nucleotide--dimethylbenzimidazole phosphoribosyltransferase [Chitinophaga nivalis]MCW3462044.1 nicotinate-nucleotide--dimethylbenzimidazole phosphoribosyltransferase [Chitinophaga nivalis]MCW3488264.1 nicotinate-nucleotide--dimethylbenzimidazole phosphoribosyltransferase [Chitinophaga nivalis]